jgi:hypothetical protein
MGCSEPSEPHPHGPKKPSGSRTSEGTKSVQAVVTLKSFLHELEETKRMSERKKNLLMVKNFKFKKLSDQS